MAISALHLCTSMHVSVSVCQCISQCKATSMCRARAKKHLTVIHVLFIEESEVKKKYTQRIKREEKILGKKEIR